ncbi:hypothetical protein LTR08_009216 [Meristemomyces frigidus]|nr:hypothetical protein LTR08_009216 [Meristemomyces frigidus]
MMATTTALQPTVATTTTALPAPKTPPAAPEAPELPSATAVTPTAAEAVFALPELLELILLQVPCPRTVLRAQAVHPVFRATITNSAPLQRKLWLLPSPTGNPNATIAAHDKQAVKTMRLNPLLLTHRRALSMRSFFLWQGSLLGTSNALIVDIHYPTLQRAMALSADRSGSWRGMVVVQPHCDGIQWSVGQCRDLRTRETVHVGLRFGGGGPPRLGELVDALVEKFGGEVGGG